MLRAKLSPLIILIFLSLLSNKTCILQNLSVFLHNCMSHDLWRCLLPCQMSMQNLLLILLSHSMSSLDSTDIFTIVSNVSMWILSYDWPFFYFHWCHDFILTALHFQHSRYYLPTSVLLPLFRHFTFQSPPYFLFLWTIPTPHLYPSPAPLYSNS